MTKNDYVKYWINTSNADFKTMLNLFKTKDYHWCLFIGHLVIEKLLKALYLKQTDETIDQPPKTHDLLLIAEKTKLETNEKQKDILDLITTFNISARYPDYKNSFYNKCTKEYARNRIKEIKELRAWLMSMIENE